MRLLLWAERKNANLAIEIRILFFALPAHADGEDHTFVRADLGSCCQNYITTLEMFTLLNSRSLAAFCARELSGLIA